MQLTDEPCVAESFALLPSNPTPAPWVPDLALRVAAFLLSWRTRLGRGWRTEAAMDLYDTLERIATDADLAQRDGIGAPALELTVYLCAFVEGLAMPNVRQCAEIERLLECLARGAGIADGGREPAVQVANDDSRRVYCLGPAEFMDDGVRAQLSAHDFLLVPFDDLTAIEQAIDARSPDVLLLGESQLQQLHPLLERAQRAGDHRNVRTIGVVIAASDDTHVRLSARRSGADLVLVHGELESLARRCKKRQDELRTLQTRVLVVDDDRSQVMLCAAALRHRGMEVHTCLRAQDVLREVAEFRPDLLLLDLYMPDGNGIQIAQQLRELPEHLHMVIVFLSGEHDLEQRCDAIRLGGDDFLTKPVKPRHLVAMVEGRARRARQLSERFLTAAAAVRSQPSVCATDADSKPKGAERTWIPRPQVQEAAPAIDRERAADPSARAALLYAQEADAVAIDYLPLVPLKGEFGDQYRVRFAFRAGPGNSELVPAERVLALADESDRARTLPRRLVQALLACLQSQWQFGPSLRLNVPLSMSCVTDPSFATWFEAELLAHQVRAEDLVFLLPLDGLCAALPSCRAALDALRASGVGLALDGATGASSERSWIELALFDRVIVAPPVHTQGADWTRERGDVIRLALANGKLVVAQAVRSTADLSELLALGVHYAQAECLAAWTDAPAHE